MAICCGILSQSGMAQPQNNYSLLFHQQSFMSACASNIVHEDCGQAEASTTPIAAVYKATATQSITRVMRMGGGCGLACRFHGECACNMLIKFGL